ncbi:MAG TPA: PD-(D/E)XK nuclease family protein, partial [Terriglobia bacterium]|nr:PD-(D/E)XK nuclease family protein [Terriglobia bacterium]
VEQQLAGTDWKKFEKLLRALGKLGKSAPVTRLMDETIERLGWRYLPGEPEEVSLAAFRKFLEGWEEKSETQRLAEFIEYFDYFLEAGGKIEAPEAAGLSNAVQMMTVHAAKGLEFPVVFMISVSPRRFPSAERKPLIEFPPALRKGPPPPPNIHLQEERRLFFVALTRAQERLYVSSVSRSEKQQSAFVQDLLSDPVLRARDVEVIRIPDIAPEMSRGDAPPAPKPEQPPMKVLLTERLSGQGRLFGSLQEGHNGLHPELAEWARRPALLPPDEKLRLSATSAEDYLGCPLRYKFQHLLKIPTAPQAALTFGNIMHQSVRHYFELRRKGLPPFEAIQDFYLNNWKSLGFDDDYQEESYRRTGLEQLRGFVEKHSTLAVDPGRIQSEQIFHLDLGDATVEGRIDQINFLDPAGAGPAAVELVDYKTGRPRSEKDAEKSLQLSIYALAARRILGLNPVRLTFYNFTNNEAVSAARTPEDLDKAVESIREIVSEIRRGLFEAKPGFMCRWCDYKPLCPAHEG